MYSIDCTPPDPLAFRPPARLTAGRRRRYTIFGDEGEKRGVMPRAAEYLFSTIKKRPQQKFAVFVSFLEIYLDKLRDLASDVPPGALNTPQPAPPLLPPSLPPPPPPPCPLASRDLPPRSTGR